MGKREEEIMKRVQSEFRMKFKEIGEAYRKVFPEKLTKDRPPKKSMEHSTETDPEAEHLAGHLIA